MNVTLKKKLKQATVLITDFDGVMTDGYVYVNERGEESVRCSRKDGLGVSMLKRAGIPVIVISKETNPTVSARCKKLQIECWQKVEDGEGKLDIIKRIARERGFPMEMVVYIGDDFNDQAPLEAVGIPMSVADGHPHVKKLCAYITRARGGEHAVREVCELLLEAKGVPLTY